ncbi:MAG TPA: class I SAM-dependent methyltransferase [Bacteroidia bacterium]|nr:class I SAM-dependent methyltransferase [Bacteroidia bacterium]
MDYYKHTITTWNQLSRQYQDGFMKLSHYDESYNSFCDLVNKKNANILELACGPGNITNYLLNQRPDFNIRATDAAPNMIALAKKNNPTATCEVLDVRNIDSLQSNYDAIVCGFCAPYLAESDFIKLINDCSTILYKKGVIYISLIEGDYSKSKLESSSDGQHSMFVYYYSEEFISNTFNSKNFSIIKIFRIPYTNGKGEKSTHLVFIAEKQ